MSNKTYFPTSHIAEVDSYPYGRKRTRAYFGTEFNIKKGYRTTFQTVNPDTGRLNAVKKSTYSDLLIMYRDEATGHIKHTGAEIISAGNDRRNLAADFCAQHFDLFTTAEIAYLYYSFGMGLNVSAMGSVRYNGASQAAVRELFTEAAKIVKQGLEAAKKGERLNLFAQVKVDHAAIDALKDPNYNPFTVTEHKRNDDGVMVSTVTKTADAIRA